MRHSRSTRAALISAALGSALGSLVVCTLSAPQSASAETILVGEQLTVRDSNVQHPAPGITMKEVEAQFGTPQQRHPSVGEPPITRWDYAGFSVFFEHDRVIHTVVAPAEAPPTTTTTTASAATTPAADPAAASAPPASSAAEAPTASAAAPAGGSDAEAPIDAARPSAPATATASASTPPLAPDAPLPADTPVSAPPSSTADAHP
jgi:hypothetical protein